MTLSAGNHLTEYKVSFESHAADFPEDLSSYDLVIHCGGCVQTRQFMLSRQSAASCQGVPMTNYGMAIACLTAGLSRLSFPSLPSTSGLEP